jgi:phosphoglycerate dehydrogenase-like enzyme
MRIAILDDYQGVALKVADWAPLQARAEITVFSDHLADEDALAERLAPFEVLCVMRERTALGRSLLERLPKLRFIASTGSINAAIDVKAAEERGIEIAHTGYDSTPTIEMTWALILASRRHLVEEVHAVRSGGWQHTLGGELAGRTLGLLGLGRIGGAVAKIGNAFGMRVIGWSQNLTRERAQEVGAEAVSKEALFSEADIVSLHTLLSRGTRSGQRRRAQAYEARGLAGQHVAGRHRGRSGGARRSQARADRRLCGGCVRRRPLRSLPNVLATPHLGYVGDRLYRTFYSDSARNILDWLTASSTISGVPSITKGGFGDGCHGEARRGRGSEVFEAHHEEYGRPKSVVTDGLSSYPAAMKEIGNADRHEVGHRLNNRAENSHQPFRRQEYAMQRFRSVKMLQKFSSVHAQAHNHYNQEASSRHPRSLQTETLGRAGLVARSRGLIADCVWASYAIHKPSAVL